MLNLYLPILQAAPTAGTGSLLTMIVPFGLIIAVFYFLIIRPQNKKQKDAQSMLSALKKNDKVVTAGGLRGTVVSVKDDSVILKVDTNTKLEFNKSAISSVLNAQGQPKSQPKSQQKSENPFKDTDKNAKKDEESQAKDS